MKITLILFITVALQLFDIFFFLYFGVVWVALPITGFGLAPNLGLLVYLLKTQEVKKYE